jgi:hypothetical protein
MLATSEEVGNPSGSVRKVPDDPACAIASIPGVFAASSGVLPINSSNGSSAMPSAKKMIALDISSSCLLLIFDYNYEQIK